MHAAPKREERGCRGRRRHGGWGAVLGVALSLAGCAAGPKFPAPIAIRCEDHQTVRVFDTDGDRQADYWQYCDSDGRVVALAYADASSAQPGARIDLDAVHVADGPHFIIALDGVPFEVVDELWRAGHFRLFRPPTRVICCYPSMTDPALAEVFGAGRCLGYQALYYDRRTGRLSDGNGVYLAGRNSPWLARMSYRCSLWWDTKVYLDPAGVFRHELAGMQRTFRAVQQGEASAYSVGSAGLGTRDGRAGIEKYLRAVDRLCEQIVHERCGRVKITLLADHGHNLVENRCVSFDDLLRKAGYRVTDRLRAPRDVVPIHYGLVTYADFYTPDPGGVADCLLGHSDVEFACYPDGDAIVVRDEAGQARIRHGAAGFVYVPDTGDPLRLGPIVEALRQAGRVSPEGEIDERALFDATVEHEYSDPLARIWGAFYEQVENPPDLIVNLRDGACHGSGFFYKMIGRVGSTHGGLNRMNSTTFVMTMVGELPAALRSRDVLPAVRGLGGE